MIRAVFLCLLGLFVTIPTHGQPTTECLRGVVTDQSGAVIPGVSIVAVSPNAERQTSTSGNDGAYVLQGLTPGISYEVHAVSPGLAQGSPRSS